MNPFELKNEQRTLGACLSMQASLRPDSEFIVFGDQSWSYRQFDEWVTTIAGGLVALGLKKGDKLAIMLPNCPEFMALWFACARIGLVEVTLNTGYRGPLLRHVVEHSDSRMAVMSQEYLERFQHELVGFGKLEKVILWSRGSTQVPDLPLPAHPFDVLETQSVPLPDVRISNLDPLALMYSSGTTGPSKGILLCHNYFWWHGSKGAEGRGVKQDDRLYTCLPLFHANAQLVTAMPVLMAGATLIIDDYFSASTFWERLRACRATQINYIGGMIPILMKQPPSPGDRKHSVRMATGGGAPKDLWLQFEERFGLRIHEGYGQTENCVALSNPLDATRVGSIGLPICGYEVDLVDDNDEPVGIDTIGELVFRPQEPYIMMDGYYKNPDATMAQSRNLWFHTGDLMKRDSDGYYYFVDRKKDAIRRRGENISAFEVEMVVNSHPAVLESAAIAVPSEVGEDEVMICMVLKPGQEVSALDLIKHCEGLMPYYAVPRFVDFRTEFPKTPTHRIEKYRLREQGVTPTTWDREKAEYKLSR
ncbi:AMP-binding protein [Noviherbaspirillum saxi]|uniref:ATP-dependent acyl-CoA ligase n=1 Tax=Noviherbaspirillum saxi TaxID=2320863 RepID=A0A3A3FQZ8_9BURK|nr:AMP-binding protein [Noviherbaspirillum saxi]RJF98642.1 ATP-dependent acyl-CoA ligase [Noviherbaspirillum saxi]